MTGYTKLFGSIVASTIWRESKETKIVWITMLAMANKNGIVEASIPGLADMARVTISECESALGDLLRPDKYSRTKEHEGRRIAAVDGGWVILNHAKYRAKMNVDERREYLAEKQREHRSKPTPDCQHGVNNSKQTSTLSTHAESKPKPKTKTPEAVISVKGFFFADWFQKLLPADFKLQGNWRRAWAKCHDEMIRIDQRTPEQIAAVCRWGRKDAFWSRAFFSPVKLRDKKDGIMYFDIMAERMKPQAPSTPPRPSGLEGIRMVS